MHRLLGLDKVWFYLHNYIIKEDDMKKLGVILILLLVFFVPAQAWERIYGGSNNDVGYSVQETLDGGYIIAGWTFSFGAGPSAVYLIKTDASGNSIWSRTYGGSSYDGGNSVQQTSDGGYIIAGQTCSFGDTLGDVYLIKTDASGDTIWTRTYGGSEDEGGSSVQQTSDEGYIIAGGTFSFGAASYDVYLIKTDASGDTIWTSTYGGSEDDWGNSVQETSDTGYIITGGTLSFGAASYDVYLIKTDASGDTIWTRTYGGSEDEGGSSVQQTSDKGYIIAGWTFSFGAGGFDVYLIKTDADGNSDYIGEDKETKPASGLLLEVRSPIEGELDLSFFLPTSGLARVELYDAAGKRVGVIEDGKRQAGWHHITHQLSLPCGVYFVQLSATLGEGYKLSRSNITQKVILLGN